MGSFFGGPFDFLCIELYFSKDLVGEPDDKLTFLETQRADQKKGRQGGHHSDETTEFLLTSDFKFLDRANAVFEIISEEGTPPNFSVRGYGESVSACRAIKNCLSVVVSKIDEGNFSCRFIMIQFNATQFRDFSLKLT